MLALWHGGKRCNLLFSLLVRLARIEQRQRYLSGESPHFPQRLAPVETDGAESIGLGEDNERSLVETRVPGEIVDGGERNVASLNDRGRCGFAEAVDLTEAEAQ